MQIWGITTCDTVRKARAALPGADFRDIRTDPLSADERAELIAAFGDTIINRASLTWRKLDEGARGQGPDALLSAHPTLMKRPVIRDDQGRLHLGWTKAVQADLGVA
ncbi:arsenate reductase family protein [Paracoccus sp. p4-l81]|uniref:arsenate reductase family protein n=1 Tax=unclassified Paracoccus (in: a-proteobacteria) TaxID=2688777 RepID=UPI0035BB7A93